MRQNVVPYAYGRPICVYVCIWEVPYAYGPIYAYEAEQLHQKDTKDKRYKVLSNTGENRREDCG